MKKLLLFAAISFLMIYEMAAQCTNCEGTTTNTETNSSAIGFETVSTGNSSFASGFRSEATANYTTAMGFYSFATYSGAFALGSTVKSTAQNAVIIGSGGPWNENIYLGNKSHGITASFRDGIIFHTQKNYLFNDGNVGIGTGEMPPETKLDVAGTVKWPA